MARFASVAYIAALTLAVIAPRDGSAQAPARVTVRALARLRWIVGDWRGTGTGGTTQAPFFERYRFADDSTLVVESYADSTWQTISETAQYELRGGRFGNPGPGAQWVAVRVDSVGVDFAPVAIAQNAFRWERAPGSGTRPDEWRATITPIDPTGPTPPRQYLMERVP
jgi:hypothetical protein